MTGEGDRWKVEGAIGVAVRIPPERMAAIGELLAAGTSLPAPLVFDNLYFTTGRGTLNGRPTEHTKITVASESPSDSPPFIVPLPAIVADPDSATARMMWKHGYTRIEGDIRISTDGTAVEVTTGGGRLRAAAVFDGETSTWSRTAELRPTVDSPTGHIGPEGGTRTHGSGQVTVAPNNRTPSQFDTYIGLDTDLFFDYPFP